MNAYEWFAARRGITRETLDAYGVKPEGEGVRFLYPEGAAKIRKTLEKVDGRHQMFWDPPTAAGQLPYLAPDFDPEKPRALLTEGETDAMAAWQAIQGAGKGDIFNVVGLSGTESWKPRYAEELFGKTKRVFVALDNDDPYEKADAAASVERGWQKIRTDLGRAGRRIRLPQGIEDLAEFFQTYDWAAFEVLLEAAARPVRHYPRLDLSQPPPPTDWLVEDLLVRGELTLLPGDSGVGKSFLMMALALAVSGGEDKFLDLSVKKHGRVLYVDEELSMQLALQRLNALGMDEKHFANLDYLWYAGVDLFHEPEKLYEEAMDMDDLELIVLDSLSKVAIGGDEDKNKDMTRFMRRNLVPLARDTGAAVALIHHTGNENVKRSRGAAALRADADQVISMVTALEDGEKTGNINIFPSKPRRRTAFLQARIVGEVERDGWARVERVKEKVPY